MFCCSQWLYFLVENENDIGTSVGDSMSYFKEGNCESVKPIFVSIDRLFVSFLIWKGIHKDLRLEFTKNLAYLFKKVIPMPKKKQHSSS